MTLLAICSALPSEQAGIRAALTEIRVQQHAGREFTTGLCGGHRVVMAITGIGKVAAATTTTALIERFAATHILFTGVAGGLGSGVQVGDVVVADALLQHDMNALPLFPRHEVPLYGISQFACDPGLSALLHAAAVETVPAPHRVHRGLIVSGDQFVSSACQSSKLRAWLPQAQAVEMEGAAVAQVCHDYRVPCAVLRTVSDRADDTAHADFSRFVQDVASHRSSGAVLGALKKWPMAQP